MKKAAVSTLAIFGASIIVMVLVSYLYTLPFAIMAFITACILAPIGEEVVYRWVPFEILSKTKYFDSLKWILAAFSSTWFAWGHSHPYELLMQGTMGFMLCWLYIKHRSLTLNVVSHSFWNLFVIYLLPSLAE